MFARFFFFSSFLVSFKNYSCNFKGEILRLVFAFAAFVTFVVSGAGWNADSNVCPRVQDLSKFFIGNNQVI